MALGVLVLPLPEETAIAVMVVANLALLCLAVLRALWVASAVVADLDATPETAERSPAATATRRERLPPQANHER